MLSKIKEKKRLIFFVLFGIFILTIPTFASISDVISHPFLSLIRFIVMLIYAVAFYFAEITGKFFDNVVVVSLSPDLYKQPWIELTWSYLRDFTNLLLLLSIIYIGFQIILNGFEKTKDLLVKVIIVAVIINFSLFFGRVIIQMGNFTGGIFIHLIDIKVNKPKNEAEGWLAPVTDHFWLSRDILHIHNDTWKPWFGNKSVSSGIMALADPRKVDNLDTFKNYFKTIKEENINIAYLSTKIFLALMFFMFAKVMLKASFAVLGRTILMIGALVSAPIKFLQHFTGDGKEDEIKKWFLELTTQSFALTKFFIGLWILFMVIAAITQEPDAGDTLFGMIFIIFTKFLIAYTILEIISKQLQEDADKEGRISGILDNTIGSVFRGVGSLATLTPLGFVTRNAVGVLGEKVKSWGDKTGNSRFGNWVGTGLTQFGDSLQKTKINGKSWEDKTKDKLREKKHRDSYLSEEDLDQEYYNRNGGNKKFNNLIKNGNALESWERFLRKGSRSINRFNELDRRKRNGDTLTKEEQDEYNKLESRIKKDSKGNIIRNSKGDATGIDETKLSQKQKEDLRAEWYRNFGAHFDKKDRNRGKFWRLSTLTGTQGAIQEEDEAVNTITKFKDFIDDEKEQLERLEDSLSHREQSAKIINNIFDDIVEKLKEGDSYNTGDFNKEVKEQIAKEVFNATDYKSLDKNQQEEINKIVKNITNGRNIDDDFNDIKLNTNEIISKKQDVINKEAALESAKSTGDTRLIKTALEDLNTAKNELAKHESGLSIIMKNVNNTFNHNIEQQKQHLNNTINKHKNNISDAESRIKPLLKSLYQGKLAGGNTTDMAVGTNITQTSSTL